MERTAMKIRMLSPMTKVRIVAIVLRTSKTDYQSVSVWNGIISISRIQTVVLLGACP